jgi:tetratricopeptide (TPR) repeat protein
MLEIATSSSLVHFLGDSVCLIVEPSQSFAFAIQSTLQSMGVPHSQVLVTRRWQDARRIIMESKPKILISEYEIDHHFAIDLFEMQGSYSQLSERISIINTLNSSESAVAEASEGDIDGYLLKPFSMSEFQQKLESILSAKMNPSAYHLKLCQGKKFLAQKEFQKAVDEFLQAKPLDPKPTLACFHTGQAFQLLGDMPRALLEFQEGLSYQPLHYRCLTGEFDALMESKNYNQAFALIETIQKNFPITSKRLGQFFVAAVFTNHFEILPQFCKLMIEFEHRSAELVRIASLAMLTSGRYYLKEQQFENAFIAFELGYQVSGKKFEILEKSVNEFLKVKEFLRAQALFNRASSAEFGKSHFKVLEFRVGQHSLSNEGLIKKGQQLMDDGYGNPEIYTAMVKAMALMGKEILAGTFINKVLKNHPELSYSLYQVLEENLKKPISND